MKRMRRVLTLGMVVAISFLFLSSCKKRSTVVDRRPTQVTPSPDIPTAVSPAPTIEISASPSTIERGKQSTLAWKSGHATSVLIDEGLGNVAESGSVIISPRQSTTFTATAKGPGGEAKSSTRVTVVDARASDVIHSTDLEALEEALRQGKIQPIFFDYDKADLTAESKRILEENAQWIRRFPGAKLILEGHCDERGTEEYNLALGDRRALAAKDYLAQLGVDPNQLETISYGEERPFDPGHDETAWAKNRRAHFVAKR